MQVGRDIIFLLHMALGDFRGHTALASGVLGVKKNADKLFEARENSLHLKSTICLSYQKENRKIATVIFSLAQ